MQRMSTSNARKKSHEKHLLPPLKTHIPSVRRPRPPTTEDPIAHRIPLRSPTTKEHKSSFRSIFRSKLDKESQPISPVVESPLSPASTRRSTKSAIRSPTLSDSFQSRTIASSLNVDSPVKGKSIDTKSKHGKKGSSPTTKPTKPVSASHHTCDPLPLFRVYPQSIKHAKLVSPALPAETIIRISNHKRNSSIREDISQSALEQEETEGAKTTKKTEKSKRKHKRHLSGSISKAEWTTKIYVLVTSGYLLQYAGEGSFDRLPEKMLQLCKDSAVFASDAIPGKHWVLQVSQAMDSDGTPAAESRSLLSKMSRITRGADYRRTATVFLLILDNAEDMEAWISAIRREIESLGGKKHVSETGKTVDDELKSPTTPRIIPRSPNRFSSATSHATDSWIGLSEQRFNEGFTNGATLPSRPLSTVRPSIDSPSISTSATSRDETWDNFRENSHHRLSYLSSSPPTIGTSRGSSTTSSPTRDKFPSNEGYSADHLRPNAMAILDRRRSMQSIENPIIPVPRSSRPHSTMVRNGQNIHSFPSNPNYCDIPETPDQQFMGSSTKFSRSPKSVRNDALETSQMPRKLSSRRRSPTSLSLTRPLTPVQDSNSPSSATHAYTPRPDAVHTPQHDESDFPIDLRRPRTASAAIAAVARLEYSSKRFSSLATMESCDSRRPAELYSTLPPTRPPPNMPLPPPPVDSSVPIIANRQYLRRPTSMQIRTNTPPPVSMHTHPIPYSNPLRPETAIPPPRSPPRRMTPAASPGSFQRPVSSREVGRQVWNRRSLPQLVNGPPVAAPPNGPLPPLPSIAAGFSL